jgi:hypothetical protein
MNGGRALKLAVWLGIFIYGYLNARLGMVLPNLMEKLKLAKSQASTFFMSSTIGLIVSSFAIRIGHLPMMGPTRRWLPRWHVYSP